MVLFFYSSVCFHLIRNVLYCKRYTSDKLYARGLIDNYLFIKYYVNSIEETRYHLPWWRFSRNLFKVSLNVWNEVKLIIFCNYFVLRSVHRLWYSWMRHRQWLRECYSPSHLSNMFLDQKNEILAITIRTVLSIRTGLQAVGHWKPIFLFSLINLRPPVRPKQSNDRLTRQLDNLFLEQSVTLVFNEFVF